MKATSPFAVPSAHGRRWDCLALGEVMLRLDPGEERIRSARQFRVWEGGGEYNVARGLRTTFGRATGVLTALPRNELGLLAEELIRQGGVDTTPLLWQDHDGIGRNTRLGLNFTERGFGVRAALGMYDRANSAAARIAAEDFDWNALFGAGGARWLHTGGIFAALSESTARTAVAAVQAARRHGVVVSYDLNYRASLWRSHPDAGAAQRVNRAIATECDLLVGDEFGFEQCLGIDATAFGQRRHASDTAPADAAARHALAEFPDLKAVAFTVRGTPSASRNTWGGVWHLRDGGRHASSVREIDILDRVGGGDAFVAGLIHAVLADEDAQTAIDLAAAHGALAMTTPGDNAMVSASEVVALARGDLPVTRR